MTYDGTRVSITDCHYCWLSNTRIDVTSATTMQTNGKVESP